MITGLVKFLPALRVLTSRRIDHESLEVTSCRSCDDGKNEEDW
jgi:hypothetical protein